MHINEAERAKRAELVGGGAGVGEGERALCEKEEQG